MLYGQCGEEVKIEGKGNKIINFILNPVENNIILKGKLSILSIVVISILTILGSIIDYKYKIRTSFMDIMMWELLFNLFKISIATLIIYILFNDEARDEKGLKGALSMVIIPSISRMIILFIGIILSPISLQIIRISTILALATFIVSLYINLTKDDALSKNKGIFASVIMVIFI
ncbi:hypothetical protein [Clostridium baratii]|uniref:Uncharacterized protein n=1 Tax=Clostridium baratii TaxID=1561 RepID=A0A174VMW4_9CLOT|nr:hypothetical protein [Clostridium baratii]CUQ32369.1 Uncharacterised protein [Clostridium baratii]